MKLTADLINNSPTYINAIKDRELDLSRNHIPLIENLGATRDLNDSLNLCNNNTRVLGNFPTLHRLKHLYISDNRIVSIEKSLHEQLPNLETLILTNNEISELVDVEPLKGFSNLTELSLMNNPLMRKKNARLWCIWRLPSLRILDFDSVKMAEREQAKALFVDPRDGSLTHLADEILRENPNTFVPGEGVGLSGDAHAGGNQGDADGGAPLDDKSAKIQSIKDKIKSDIADIEAMEEFI